MNRITQISLLLFSVLVLFSCGIRTEQEDHALVDKMDTEFSIGIFWPPVWEHTTDTQYKWIKEAHIDFIENVKNADLFTEEQNLRMLELADRYGFRVSVADPRIFGSDDDIRSAVEVYRDLPALEGYYIKDEPDSTEFEWAAAIYQKLVALDSTHVPHVNLFPNFVIPNYETNHVERWVNTVGAENLKYLMFDQYPFTADGYIRPTYFENLEIIRRVGINYRVKTAAYLQSVGIMDVYHRHAYRRPTPSELRFNMFTALAYGIKRPVWFTYWTPTNAGKEIFMDAIIDPQGNKTDLYEPFSKLNERVKPIGHILFNLDAVEVFHSGSEAPIGTQTLPEGYFWSPIGKQDDLLISRFSDHRDQTYVMVVNKSLTVSKQFAFKLSGDVTRVDGFTVKNGQLDKHPVAITDGQMTDHFLPGEGKLFAVEMK